MVADETFASFPDRFTFDTSTPSAIDTRYLLQKRARGFDVFKAADGSPFGYLTMRRANDDFVAQVRVNDTNAYLYFLARPVAGGYDLRYLSGDDWRLRAASDPAARQAVESGAVRVDPRFVILRDQAAFQLAQRLAAAVATAKERLTVRNLTAIETARLGSWRDASAPPFDLSELVKVSAGLHSTGLDQPTAVASLPAIQEALKKSAIRVVDERSEDVPHLEADIAVKPAGAGVSYAVTISVQIGPTDARRVVWTSGSRTGSTSGPAAPALSATLATIMAELIAARRAAIAAVPFGDQPFGVTLGASKQALRSMPGAVFEREVDASTQTFRRLPRSDPRFDGYILQFSPSNRVCRITALGAPVQASGKVAIRIVDRVQGQLEARYGRAFPDADGPGMFWDLPSAALGFIHLYSHLTEADSKRDMSLEFEGDEDSDYMDGCPPEYLHRRK